MQLCDTCAYKCEETGVCTTSVPPEGKAISGWCINYAMKQRHFPEVRGVRENYKNQSRTGIRGRRI